MIKIVTAAAILASRRRISYCREKCAGLDIRVGVFEEDLRRDRLLARKRQMRDEKNWCDALSRSAGFVRPNARRVSGRGSATIELGIDHLHDHGDGRTIGSRIRMSQPGGVSARCNVSRVRDRPSSSSPYGAALQHLVRPTPPHIGSNTPRARRRGDEHIPDA